MYTGFIGEVAEVVAAGHGRLEIHAPKAASRLIDIGELARRL